MGVNSLYKLKKSLLKFMAFCVLVVLTFFLNIFEGYRWHGFLARIILVVILLELNPYSSAVSYSSTGGMKLFLLTCAILAYSICKLIFDYTKRGQEFERKRRIKSEDR
ncbi:hypothetical protein [Methylotenera sp. L2L1]|uniref:hypothetical protein n=1 Tax=Methylotenera sp. L2L1 TaxID=1502770 RepID=UPI0005683E69|nr:hypothetical protein [Methylotenera sp. L2L1]